MGTHFRLGGKNVSGYVSVYIRLIFEGNHMRNRLLAGVVAGTIAFAVIAAIPTSAQAAHTQAPRNTGLSGTWIGTQKGFESGTYVTRQVRLVVTKVKGEAMSGTKSWREINGSWSEPETFQGAVMKSGEFRAVDEDGYFIGELISPTRIRATYLEAGADQTVLISDLKKATR